MRGWRLQAGDVPAIVTNRVREILRVMGLQILLEVV